jgi:hypothetical protein
LGDGYRKSLNPNLLAEVKMSKDRKEYQKEYYKEYGKKYRELNRKKIKEYQVEY